MRIATAKKFDGRQARVGDDVLLAGKKHDGDGTCLHAGRIVAISSSDRPYILDYRTGKIDWEEAAWTFAPTGTDTKAEKMAVGSWTWIPRA